MGKQIAVVAPRSISSRALTTFYASIIVKFSHHFTRVLSIMTNEMLTMHRFAHPSSTYLERISLPHT